MMLVTVVQIVKLFRFYPVYLNNVDVSENRKYSNNMPLPLIPNLILFRLFYKAVKDWSLSASSTQ